MKQLFLFITCIYIIGFVSHAIYLHKTVYGDGIYYFSWVHSVRVDGDINFLNEYTVLGGTQPQTSIGLTGNKYAIGPALLWSPFYFVAHNLIGGDGYGFPYQLIVGLVNVGFTLVGLILLFRLLTKYFDESISMVTILVLAGATNLLFYGSIDPVNSHAGSFFAVVLFLSLLLTKKRNWIAIGASLGLIGLMRLQDIVFALLIIPFLDKKNVIPIISGFTILFLPQLLAWQLLYGSFFINPYISGGEGFSISKIYPLQVLFNVQNGLFVWTPIVLFGLIGLIINIKKRIPMTGWFLFIFFTEVLIVSSWSSWNQGASYSGRMFVSSLPLVAFGIASLFFWLKNHAWSPLYFWLIFIIPLSVINGASIIRFLVYN